MITRRMHGAMTHAFINRYEPLRMWLSPVDYCELMHYAPPGHEHDPIAIHGIPVTLDRWEQGSRLVLSTGHRIIF